MTVSQLPFGQLPLLQIDGIEIVQTQAILRYLARRANLTGETQADEMKCEVLVETIRGKVKGCHIMSYHIMSSIVILLRIDDDHDSMNLNVSYHFKYSVYM